MYEQKGKTLRAHQNSQKNVRFQDFCTFMTYFGIVLVGLHGSHHLYQHAGIEEVMNVQPTKDNLAKAYQVQQFLKLIDRHNLELEDEVEDEQDEQ